MKTYDLAVFQTSGSPVTPDMQVLWGVDGDGVLLTGIRKLAQRFLLELLTIRGSMPFAQDRGSSLMVFVKEGRIRSEVDAHMYFQYAVGEIEPNLFGDVLSTDDHDEQYKSVTIDSITFTPTHLAYKISLTSVAGTSRTVTLPLAV